MKSRVNSVDLLCGKCKCYTKMRLDIEIPNEEEIRRDQIEKDADIARKGCDDEAEDGHAIVQSILAQLTEGAE